MNRIEYINKLSSYKNVKIMTPEGSKEGIDKVNRALIDLEDQPEIIFTIRYSDSENKYEDMCFFDKDWQVRFLNK